MWHSAKIMPPSWRSGWEGAWPGASSPMKRIRAVSKYRRKTTLLRWRIASRSPKRTRSTWTKVAWGEVLTARSMPQGYGAATREDERARSAGAGEDRLAGGELQRPEVDVVQAARGVRRHHELGAARDVARQ